VETQFPRKDGETEARYDGRVRSKYVDNCRFILPATSLANVGMTANARVFENSIRKWLSHPLEEVREIGEEVKAVALSETPTLVKYADRVPYLAELHLNLPANASPAGHSNSTNACATLVDYDREGETKFLAAILYRFSGLSYDESLALVSQLDESQRDTLTQDALGALGKYDVPLRELEHVQYTFDTLMDQGGYFEVKRHRMMSQTPQRLTCDLGFAVPSAFEAAGIRAEYEAAMCSAADTYRALAAQFPEEASYVVPNAFNRRMLATFNLREAFSFCELRSAPNAHFSVRRVAAQVYAEIKRVHPRLAKFIRCGERPAAEAIEAEYFVKV
jgi:thymidylate synthase ThyX